MSFRSSDLAHASAWHPLTIFILFCLVGGAAGFFIQPPVYRAVALFGSSRPWVVVNSSQTWGDAQRLRILSMQTMNVAIAGPDWQKVWATDQRTAQRMIDRLEVGAANGGMIEVVYADPDPEVAEGRLKAVVLAHRKLEMERESAQDMNRLRILYERVSSLSRQLADSDRRIVEASDELQENKSVSPVEGPRRLEQLRAERAALNTEKDRVESRITSLTILHAPAEPLVVFSAAKSPWIDHRWHNAAWGVGAGLILFISSFLLWSARRGRNRASSARGAFPVI